MNTIRFITAAVFALISSTLFAQEKEITFNVSGNCTMCKKRIEKAAASLTGVKSADWNVKTKQATVLFDLQKVSEEVIQKKIAQTGHDAQGFKADDASYYSLPSCCQYNRKPQSTTTPNKH